MHYRSLKFARNSEKTSRKSKVNTPCLKETCHLKSEKKWKYKRDPVARSFLVYLHRTRREYRARSPAARAPGKSIIRSAAKVLSQHSTASVSLRSDKVILVTGQNFSHRLRNLERRFFRRNCHSRGSTSFGVAGITFDRVDEMQTNTLTGGVGGQMVALWSCPHMAAIASPVQPLGLMEFFIEVLYTCGALSQPLIASKNLAFMTPRPHAFDPKLLAVIFVPLSGFSFLINLKECLDSDSTLGIMRQMVVFCERVECMSFARKQVLCENLFLLILFLIF